MQSGVILDAVGWVTGRASGL